jgi:hypothetical protein
MNDVNDVMGKKKEKRREETARQALISPSLPTRALQTFPTFHFKGSLQLLS